jgi:hypothetical protein
MPATLQEALAAFIASVGADIKAINTALANGGGLSQQDIDDAIAGLRDELRAGAGAALDTFAEVAQALADDDTAAAALATAIANRVRFDEAQVLTPEQKAFALANIGGVAAADIGNPKADLVALYTAAKA